MCFFVKLYENKLICFVLLCLRFILAISVSVSFIACLKRLRAIVIHFIGSLAGDDGACGQASYGVEAADWLRSFHSKLSSGCLLDEQLE